MTDLLAYSAFPQGTLCAGILAVACSAPHGAPVSPGAPSSDTFAILDVNDLGPAPSRTTPQAVALVLYQNMDHLQLRASLADAQGSPVSSCQIADVYRIGPDAVDWPVRSTFDVPLAYDEVLPSGLYTQKLHVHADSGALDFPYEVALEQYFDVTDAGLTPVTSAEYFARTEPVSYDALGRPQYPASIPSSEPPPGDPCPEPEPYSDETSPERATSRIDFDEWSNVSTIQPLRWQSGVVSDEHPVASSPLLELYARNAAGARIQLQISVPDHRWPADFDTDVGRISIDEPAPPDERRATSWTSRTGHFSIQVTDALATIQLRDVLLDRSRLATDPPVTRTIASGVISGAWIAE